MERVGDRREKRGGRKTREGVNIKEGEKEEKEGKGIKKHQRERERERERCTRPRKSKK